MDVFHWAMVTYALEISNNVSSRSQWVGHFAQKFDTMSTAWVLDMIIGQKRELGISIVCPKNLYDCGETWLCGECTIPTCRAVYRALEEAEGDE